MKVYLSLLEIDTNYKIIDHVHPIHHIDFGTTSDLKFVEYDG